RPPAVRFSTCWRRGGGRGPPRHRPALTEVVRQGALAGEVTEQGVQGDGQRRVSPAAEEVVLSLESAQTTTLVAQRRGERSEDARGLHRPREGGRRPRHGSGRQAPRGEGQGRLERRSEVGAPPLTRGEPDQSLETAAGGCGGEARAGSRGAGD